MLTASEVASMLSVSSGTVRRWALTDQIPAIRLPSGVFRFQRQDIEALLTPMVPLGQPDESQQENSDQDALIFSRDSG